MASLSLPRLSPAPGRSHSVGSRERGRGRDRPPAGGGGGAAIARAGGGGRAGREERELLERLSRSLSDEELRRVLAGGLLALEVKGAVGDLVERLGPDTGAALRAALATPAGGARGRVRAGPLAPGKARVRQEWERAWAEWAACVAETGDEEGRYVIREPSWETPTMDIESLEEDLDRIARRLLPLIPRVVDDDLFPGFDFAGEVRGMDEDLGAGLPEWILAAEGWSLGPGATRALLDWEWRSGQRSGRSAFDFANRICGLEDSLSTLGLDGGVISKFVAALPPADRRLVLEGIRARAGADHWKRALESPRTTWAGIHLELARRNDPALYLETCAANMEQDWRLGLPVLRDFLKMGDPGAALEVARKAADAMSHDPGIPWDPRETLLDGAIWGYDRSPGEVLDLLDGWRRAAAALGDGETAAALRLQIAACDGREKPDHFLDEVRAVQGDFPPVADRLFVRWRARVCLRTDRIPLSGRMDWDAEDAGWVHALVDAARAGPGAGETLARGLREWLAAVREAPDSRVRAGALLGILTLDLDHEGRVTRHSRALHRLLDRIVGRFGDPALRKWRRLWLQRLGARVVLDEVLEVWKRVAIPLVPDPAEGASPDYGECADWLAVAAELDPEGCRTLLARWSVDHRRRRNLWKKLRARGLAPVGGA